MDTYIFDGSFEGLLCSVYEWFERKPGQVILKTPASYQPDAFSNSLTIYNDQTKASRVWTGLQRRLNKSWLRKIYCAYLSENEAVFVSLFELFCYLFTHEAGAEQNYGNPHVLSISQIAIKVEREKHRMEAFIRFQHTADGIFYCGIDPDFNVLPLITTHFKNRYADQKWIIYDLKRKYGASYDLEKVDEIQITFDQAQRASGPLKNTLSEDENLYNVLWKDYFKSTNIPMRKNTRLHLQHVPKRYWKYLTEKQQ